ERDGVWLALAYVGTVVVLVLVAVFGATIGATIGALLSHACSELPLSFASAGRVSAGRGAARRCPSAPPDPRAALPAARRARRLRARARRRGAHRSTPMPVRAPASPSP